MMKFDFLPYNYPEIMNYVTFVTLTAIVVERTYLLYFLEALCVLEHL